ncbi:nucleotidyltransferase family protein [Halomonas sp. THAF12]
MNREHQILSWLMQDAMRMAALRVAASMNLRDWCIGAGFVRNLVWDKSHGYTVTTPLNDIDLIYHDSSRASEEHDAQIEGALKETSDLPWSVKNQARMHLRNGDEPYASTSDAMRHWVELETAVGAALSCSGEVKLVAPFGVDRLFDSTITINPGHRKPEAFLHRIQSKRWLESWPNLKVVG